LIFAALNYIPTYFLASVLVFVVFMFSSNKLISSGRPWAEMFHSVRVHPDLLEPPSWPNQKQN
jgi:hypothetical protein